MRVVWEAFPIIEKYNIRIIIFLKIVRFYSYTRAVSNRKTFVLRSRRINVEGIATVTRMRWVRQSRWHHDRNKMSTEKRPIRNEHILLKVQEIALFVRVPLNEPDREIVVTTVAFKSTTINPRAVPRFLHPRARISAPTFAPRIRPRNVTLLHDKNKISKTWYASIKSEAI